MITTKQINEIFDITKRLFDNNNEYLKTKELYENENTKSAVNAENYRKASRQLMLSVAEFDDWVKSYKTDNFDFPFSKPTTKQIIMELKLKLDNLVDEYVENFDE